MTGEVMIAQASAAEIGNRVLSDVARACVGDPGARARLRPDLIGGLMLTGRAEDAAGRNAEFVVVAYPGAGCQMWIAADGGSPDVIDLRADAARNDDPTLLAAVREAAGWWLTDPATLGGDLLSEAESPYR